LSFLTVGGPENFVNFFVSEMDLKVLMRRKYYLPLGNSRLKLAENNTK
jgi:hypothetical protein